MGDIDEYDLLDQQLDAGAKAGEKGEDRDRERSHKRHKHKDSDRERHKSHRSSRHKDDDDDERSERKRRHRSRSRERRSHRSSRHDDEGRHRSRSSGGRHERLPSPPRRRAPTPPEVLEQREKERELKELDRDTRTVFAYNLNLKADEKDLFDFFSRVGTVEDVRIITDRNTRRSKGFAYIEMGTRDAVMGALALAGQTLMGQTVMVKTSEAEKNLAWEAAQVQNQQLQVVRQLEGATGTGPCKLHIRNVHVAMQEDDVREIFAPYGAIDLVQIQRDGAGKSQGHGYVTFSSAADATRAIQQLNGLEIAGAAIKVEIAPDPSATAAAFAANAVAQADADDGEDESGTGLRLTATARAQLMSRLAGGQGTSPGGAGGAVQAPAGFVMPGAAAPPAATAPSAPPLNPLSYVQGVLGPASPIPTQCLLLKNMFDPAEETEPDWPDEIASDTKGECSKYGAVTHIHVDKESKGFVYLRFESVTAAQAAQKALHGRWFAGKQVCAEFQFVAPYAQRFGA